MKKNPPTQRERVYAVKLLGGCWGMRQSSGGKFISHTSECIFICAPSTMIFFAASRSIFIFCQRRRLCVWGWFGGQLIPLSRFFSIIDSFFFYHRTHIILMWKLSYCYVCGVAIFYSFFVPR